MTSERRLRNELKRLQQLNTWSSMINVIPVDDEDDAPTEYDVFFEIKSVIDSAGNTRNKHHARIYLPADYPKIPPKVQVSPPIYHPNIANKFQNTRFMNERAAELDRIYDPDEFEAYIRRINNNPDYKMADVCLDILELNWASGLTLVDVVIQVAEMLQYKLIADDHALNQEAARWAKQHKSELPTDNRILLDNLPEEEAPKVEETDEVEIELLDNE